MSFIPERSSARTIVKRGEVEFGVHILSEIKKYSEAAPNEKNTYGFGFITEGIIADVVVSDAIPSYEREVQKKSGIFLLTHSEVNLVSLREKDAA